MAPFSLPDTFQKARCMTNGQLTPPPSPQNAYHTPVRFRAARKVQIARPSTRRLRRASVRNTRSAPGCADSDLVSITMSSRVTECENGTPQFAPSPTSPISEEKPSIRPFPIAKHPVGLRHRLDSYHDLRTLAKEQPHKEQFLEPMASSLLLTPLLPSPIIDQRNMESSGCFTSNLKFQSPRLPSCSSNLPNYKSYDDLQILSCYEDNPYMSTEEVDCTSEQAGLSLPHKQIQRRYPEMSATGEKQHLPTPSPSSGSAESDWLANTTSHEQRLHKFKSRCYQVVQHPSQPIASGEEEGRVMLATVLVGPGRPRLVQIQRPKSSTDSAKSCQTPPNQSSQWPTTKNQLAGNLPSTPIHQKREISAFSPYDTPSVVMPYTDRSPIRRSNDKSSTEQSPFTASKLDLIPRPLTLSLRDSSESDELVSSSNEHYLRSVTKNVFFTSPTANNASSISTSTVETSWLTNLDDMKTSLQPLEKSHILHDRRNQLERKLDKITQTIEDFPSLMINLESQLLIDIRGSADEIKNNNHINTLSKVFIDAPKQLISSLAAWIIIDSYVSSLHDDHHIPFHQHQPQTPSPSPPKPPIIPSRSVSLGFSKSYLKSKYDSTYRLFPSPPKSKTFHHHYHHHHNNGTSPDSDDSILISTDSIPIKARSILGIDPDKAWRSDEQLLLTRARALSISIGVIAQKLVEVLRGENGWDPYLWRALSVAVQTVETSGTLTDVHC